MASPAEFKKEAGPDNIIGCGRPFDESTMPIALLDEAFAVFKADVQSPSMTSLLGELTEVCCKWVDSEQGRQDAVQKVFKRHAPVSRLRPK